MSITVREIVVQYLQEHGYDGLRGWDCGCILDDLMPCSCDGVEDCTVAYKGPPLDEEFDYGMYETKEEVRAAELTQAASVGLVPEAQS